MAPLWKSYALFFAFLAGRRALGAGDDVDGDAVETYFNMDAYEDAYRFYDMTSNKGFSGIGNLRDAGDVDVAMSTAGSSRGDHSQGVVDEQTAFSIGTSNGEGSVLNVLNIDELLALLSNDPLHSPPTAGDGPTPSWVMASNHNPLSRVDGTRVPDPASHAIDHQHSGTSTWASADDRSYMIDSTRQEWVSDGQQRFMPTSNFDAGATTSSSVSTDVDTEVECEHCGTRLLKQSLRRHQKHNCPKVAVRALSYCPNCPNHPGFSQPCTLRNHQKHHCPALAVRTLSYCPNCPNHPGFNQPLALRKHLKHHCPALAVRTLSYCPNCPNHRGFRRPDSMDRHLKTCPNKFL